MVYGLVREQCCGCGSCQISCPSDAITMAEDEEGFLYPVVNETKCTHCGMCQRTCPFAENNGQHGNGVRQGYAAYHKEEEIRLSSSSGGMFSALAEEVFRLNGAVYGVALSEDILSAVYIRAESLEELQRTKGSKYFQARTGDVYKRVKEDLENNRWILFSGTPCQINGLNGFLGKSYEKLVCVDIICHGVPSPLLWRTYVKDMGKRYGQCTGVSFRDKTYGWKNFSMKHLFKNRSNVIIPMKKDIFMYFFLKNYCLRPSCYACKAKTYRTADITLGDFWGIEQIYPEMDDDKGISLVLTRTGKGQEFIERVKDGCFVQAVDAKAAVLYNEAEYCSPEQPEQRADFYQILKDGGMAGLKRKYYVPLKKDSIIRKAGRKIRRIFGIK